MNRLTLTILAISTLAAHAGFDGATIEELTGLKGTLNEAEGVFKITSPRTDVKVAIDGWQMPPFMGLTSWAGFTTGKKVEAMLMGDLVLMQDEVNPVMSTLLDSGLAVTALHNHFFYDEPKVYFMHIGGEGTTEKLAAGVKAVLDKVKEIRAAQPEIATGFGKPFSPASNAIDGAGLNEVFGSKGLTKDGMYKVVFGRMAKADLR